MVPVVVARLPRGSRVAGVGPGRRLAVWLVTWLGMQVIPGDLLGQGERDVCPDGRVTRVFVENHSVFDPSDPRLDPRLDFAYRLANHLHIETREGVIRREILLQEGDCYEEARLRDSERMLRALGFIAEANVTAVRQTDDGVHVFVTTRDEWSLRVEPRVGSGGRARLAGLRLRQDNALGAGVHVSAFYFDRSEERVFGATFFTPQLFQSRWDGLLEAGKTPIGYLVSQAIAYPFVGETGRWAFRQGLYHNQRWFEYRATRGEGVTPVLLPESRMLAEVGGMYRHGRQRDRRLLVGLALRAERLSYSGGAEYGSAHLRSVAPPPALGVTLDTVENVRAVFLMGQRHVSYVRRRGLDTVRGTEDVRLGVESQLAIAPGLPLSGGGRDLRLGLDLSAASDLPSSGTVGLHFLFEGRHDPADVAATPPWRDVFAHLRTWGYWRGDPDGTDLLVTSIAASGGWNVRVPYQLTLGSDVGLRGFPEYLDPGGRRVVASAEYRRYHAWPLPHLFDFGTVWFLDAGKMWAGDAPFGVTSPLRAAVGVGLRGAFPPGSRRTLRVDVGVPLSTHTQPRDVTLSVGMGQWIGRSPRLSDPQMRRSVHLWSRQSILAVPSD